MGKHLDPGYVYVICEYVDFDATEISGFEVNQRFSDRFAKAIEVGSFFTDKISVGDILLMHGERHCKIEGKEVCFARAEDIIGIVREKKG